jgi:hypothetical protein
VGANHNFFNAEWTPGHGVAPSGDDWTGPADELACGTDAPGRLSTRGAEGGPGDSRGRTPRRAPRPAAPTGSRCSTNGLRRRAGDRLTATHGLNFGYDFDAPEGSPLFGFVEEGQTRGAIDVHVIDDGEAESDETLEVDIRSVEGAAVTHPTAVVVTIVDDD